MFNNNNSSNNNNDYANLSDLNDFNDDYLDQKLLNQTSVPKSNNSDSNYDEYQALKIKTKSIENALLPLVTQISTLVNFKENLRNNLRLLQQQQQQKLAFSEKTTQALIKVGDAVNLAVGRFVCVGETIAYENPTIRMDMLDACREARNAGLAIKTHTQLPSSVMNETIGAANNHSLNNQSDKFTLIQAANILLNSVTKVLLLADVVIINQILNSKNKVLLTLNKLEGVGDFSGFVATFTQYGNDLIVLAQLSGERQNDLKDEKRRSQLSSARWVLEKSTAMLLSSSKAYLKHMECECAKENVSLVYAFLYQSLDTLHHIIVDSGTMFDCSTRLHSNLLLKSSISQMSFTNAYRQFEDALDLAKNNMITEANSNLVVQSLQLLINSIQDYTNSRYINNDQRERISRIQNEIRDQILVCLKEDSNNNNNKETNNGTNNKFNRLYDYSSILNDCEVLKKLLQSQTMQLANCLFRENRDAGLLNYIKTYALSNHYDLLVETLDKFKEYSEQVLELCKLLRHISNIDVFEVTCEHHYNVFDNLAKMIQSSASALALYPACKSVNDNLNLFSTSWENQVNDLSVLVKEMQDSLNGVKSSKSIYLSLPKPGKHGTSNRSSTFIAPSKLDSNEQAKILKLGLEMKLIQSEIEAEADRWNEPQNEIVKIAKQMSDMAYEIHLFTRGEGSLKTTQDLFSKAEVFLEYGVLLYGIVKDFLAQVPDGFLKQELLLLIERIPLNFKLLKSKLKQQTAGKKATFNKVDCVIQETRDFMNLITKLVTSCFLCSTKYNINYEAVVELNRNVQDQNQNTNRNNSILNDEDVGNNNFKTHFSTNNYNTNTHRSQFSLINNLLSDSSQPKFRANSLNRVSNYT